MGPTGFLELNYGALFGFVAFLLGTSWDLFRSGVLTEFCAGCSFCFALSDLYLPGLEGLGFRF